MIYLRNIKFTSDVLFEKSRSTHELFKQKTEVIKGNSGYRNKTDVTKHYFKIFEKGLSIDLDNPVTIIAGDNGTGKSTLLKFLRFQTWQKGWDDDTPAKEHQSMREHVQKYLKSEARTLLFESMPERIYFMDGLHKSVISEAMGNELSKKAVLGESGVAKLAAQYHYFQYNSNGEALLDMYEGFKEIKNSVIMLDEPETSMSLKSSSKLCIMIKDMIANNNQFIISTHHPIFMRLSKDIYDIEKKKFVETENYLKSFSDGI